MPACSIIIAEYNNGKYFLQLYESLLKQALQDFEVIIVDDASTDNTVKLVKEKITGDNRFKLILHDSNKGAGAAFKTAMLHANGDVILMLGADDTLAEDAIKVIVDSHKQYPDFSLINFSLFFCDENLNILRKLVYQEDKSREEYFFWTTKGIDTFKRTKYFETIGFDENLRSAVDQDICFKLEETGKVISLDKAIYYYRANPKGISQMTNKLSSKINYCLATFNTYERRKISGAKNISLHSYHQVKCEYYYYKAFLFYNNNQIIKCFIYLMTAYFIRKLIYRVRLPEGVNKEIGYYKYNLIHQNKLSSFLKKILKK